LYRKRLGGEDGHIHGDSTGHDLIVKVMFARLDAGNIPEIIGVIFKDGGRKAGKSTRH
jgi:hypothetical protein